MEATPLVRLPEPLAQGNAYRLVPFEGRMCIQAVALMRDGSPEGGGDPNWYDVDLRDSARETELYDAIVARVR